jgi:hypothetical protein
MKLCWNFSQQTQPIHSIRPKTHVLGRFGPCCYCTKVDEKLDEQVLLTHTFAKQTHVRIFRNERTRSTLLDTKLMFWRRFGLFHYRTKVDAKLAELAPLTHKFAKRSCVRTFRNQRTDPLYWTQNSCFSAFQNILLLHESRCQTGRTSATNAQVR